MRPPDPDHLHLEVERAAIELVRAEPGILAGDLDDQLDERFADQAAKAGLSSEELVDDVLDQLCDDDGALTWLPGDRSVHVGDLTDGIVLTHRLTDVEQRVGTLNAGFDLSGFGRRDDLRLPGGGEIVAFSVEPHHLGWRGPDGWLDEFAPDDLLAVRVDDLGTVTLDVIDEPLVEPRLVDRVRAAYDAEVEDYELPVRAERLVLALQFDDPSTFASPQPPLADLCGAAGLDRRQDSVAHDEALWERDHQLTRMTRVVLRCEDPGLAQAVVRVLGVADLLAGVPADEIMGVDAEEGPVDGRRLRALLAELGDLRVLVQVAFELFEHPAPDDRDTGALVDAFLDVASKPADVAAAHHLAALRAERSLDPFAAEHHLQLALRADPSDGAVVDRLAWYASDRGDAATATRLWSRLDRRRVAQDLAEVEGIGGGPGPERGRNEPCWCGSGRKYKQCHLGQPRTEALPPLPDRVGWLCRKATAFLERRLLATMDDMITIAEIVAGGGGDERSFQAAFGEPIVTDLVLHELGWFDQFLSERGPLLPDDERLLARSWTLVDRTIYEVEAAEPGEALRLRDVRTGEVVDVRERSLSRQIAPLQLLCGRAVPDGEGHQLIGGVLPVSPGTEARLLDALDHQDAYAVAGYAAALRQPPVLTTREGEATVSCSLELDLAASGQEAARAFLDEAYDPLGDEPDRWHELHPIDEDESIVRAHLRLDGDRLHVETNSEERADRVLATVLAGLPGALVVSDDREPMDFEAIQAEAAHDAAAGAAGGGPSLVLPGLGDSADDDPEMAEALEEIIDRMERRWCDESVPALGGRTPRECAADPTRRHEVERLIASFESRGPVLPGGGGGFRPDRLRRLLGLADP